MKVNEQCKCGLKGEGTVGGGGGGGGGVQPGCVKATGQKHLPVHI